MASHGDRLARWWAGWRVALRMTRRDVRRHKGRAVLVVLLVGLPVLLISAGATLLATDSVEPAEELAARMGQAQASISYQPHLFDQAERPGGQAAHHEQALADLPKLVAGTLIPTTMSQSRVLMGERKVEVTVLGIDGRNSVTAGMVSLTSGRWPAADDEVLVTPLALTKGIPASGTLTLRAPDRPARTLTIVGQGSAGGHFQRELIAFPAISEGSEISYLVDRADPVTWTDVKALHAAGYDVMSRAVLLEPSEAKADPASDGRFDDGVNADVVGLVALIAVGMVLETALLAGPAFAVAAARSRRALALAAANGADKRQLRRHVLGHALLLGGVAAAAGAALGPLAARVGIQLWTRAHPEHNLAAVFDVPLGQVLAIVVCAVLASLAAAFAPAVGAARLDLVAVLRGHRAHRPAHRGMPVLGLVVAIAGGAVIVNAIVNRGREMSVAVGAVLLVGGTLLLIPMLLSLVGRWGARLPLPLRMAARDTGRQRGRAVPTVAAIMAAVATLTALAIGGFSDEAQGERDYQPLAPVGHGLLQGIPTDLADARAVITEVDPTLTILDLRVLRPDRSVIDPANGREGIITVLPSGCSDQDALDWTATCSLDGAAPSLPQSSIRVLTVDELSALTKVTAVQRQVLASGGLIVAEGSIGLDAGHARLVEGVIESTADGFLRLAKITSATTMATASMPATALAALHPRYQPDALITPETAERLGLSVELDGLDLVPASGSLSNATAQAIKDRLGDATYLYVEQGYRSGSLLVFLVLFVVFGLLVLVATLISTALSLAEGRADMATLAAVGAPRRLRRAVAASQAFVVGLCGALLGLVVGLVPGIAITWPLTAGAIGPNGGFYPEKGPPVIVIPWLPLAAVVVGVPVLAALVSALAVRRSPQVTRRLT